MPRPLSSRAYGCVEDSEDSRLLPLPESASNAPADVHRDLNVRENVSVLGRGPRRWGKLVVLGLTAVTVAAMLRSGRGTSARTAAADGSVSEEFVEVRGGARTGGLPGKGPSALSPLTFTSLNYYSFRDGQPGQDYPWLKDVKLVEPYRETFFRVENPVEGLEYRWSIDGGNVNEIHTLAKGREAIVLLSRLDENVVTLEEVDGDGVVTRRLDETIMVKYVRREIRALTEDEREELFDAMFTLWTVRADGSDGKDIYGDEYADIWAINRLHFKAASPRVCDHFHDGLGFLTNHALMSNTFEHSLQMVNPKLTLPYWDFTIETSSATTGANDPDAPPVSPLLQASWFGTTDPEDFMVKDGRWAYTEIPKMRVNNPGGVEPDVWSKLRAPWNVNHRPYLTRGIGSICGADMSANYPWPTCANHYSLVTSYTDFYSWVWESMYDPHGPVHIWIGGVVDCFETYSKMSEIIGETDAMELALLAFVHRKGLFRNEFFGCGESVDVSESGDEVFKSGVCGCLGYDLTQGDDYKDIIGTLASVDDLLADAPDDTKRELVALLCSGEMNDGDHLQASSSLDPSFWPTHPAMERLWMFSVISGQVTDFTWPDEDVTIYTDDGKSYTEMLSLYSEDCAGHHGSDVFPYGLSNDTTGFKVQTGIRGNPAGGGNVFTNREALAALDPRGSEMSYIYDNFKWPHCEADGVNMDDAWTASTSSDTDAAAPKKRMRFETEGPRFPMYSSIVARVEELKKRREEL